MSDPIRGTGRRGFGFEKKGFQDRNLADLLKILSKKETQKAIEDLSKIKKDEWKAMAETATMLNSFVSLGGNVAFFNIMKESIKETIKLQIESLLSPITNEINQAITDLLGTFLTDVINPIVNDITTFFSENAVGTGAGGIAGAVIGAFLGNPAIGALIGAAVGAVIEDELTKFFAGEKSLISDAENVWPIIETLWERIWNNLFGIGGGGGGSSGPGPGNIRELENF